MLRSRLAHADGDRLLSAALRLIALLLGSHPRNQTEMLRSDGMSILGHMLLGVEPSRSALRRPGRVRDASDWAPSEDEKKFMEIDEAD